jgi:hypothetical protein
VFQLQDRENASYNVRKVSGTGKFWTADSTERVPDTGQGKLHVQDRESARYKTGGVPITGQGECQV